MNNNVFLENIKEIIAISYAGGIEPVRDWNTSLDMFIAQEKLFDVMSAGEINAQRSEFLKAVDGKAFDREGNEVK